MPKNAKRFPFANDLFREVKILSHAHHSSFEDTSFELLAGAHGGSTETLADVAI